MTLAELRPRLHTLPDRPDWIPYRTTYYKRDWGFCLSHNQLRQLEDGEYDVCIDSMLAPGSLTYGELLVRGETNDEFLISAHCCHPSLANDNLSGIAVAVALARAIPLRKLSFRFLFVPGTIGAITWLARNQDRLARIKHGLVLTCVGDAGNITYKKSRRGDAGIDRAVQCVLSQSGEPHRVIDFFPYGYDERQYCSPGFNLPVGCFMRSQHGTFPQYHTSADNLDFIKPEALADSLQKILSVVDLMENDSGAPSSERAAGAENGNSKPGTDFFLNLKPNGEPQLGKYGLYEALDGDVMSALWILNYSDGQHSLQKIAARAGLPFDKVARTADILVSRGLLKEVKP
jgi:aminopeptidase-like protein